MLTLNEEVKPLLQEKNASAASYQARSAAATLSASHMQKACVPLTLIVASSKAGRSPSRIRTSASHTVHGKSHVMQKPTGFETLAIEVQPEGSLAWDRPAAPTFLDL